MARFLVVARVAQADRQSGNGDQSTLRQRIDRIQYDVGQGFAYLAVIAVQFRH